MANNYSLSKDHRYRGHLFKISFLLIQLGLYGAVLAFLLTRHANASEMISSILR